MIPDICLIVEVLEMACFYYPDRIDQDDEIVVRCEG